MPELIFVLLYKEKNRALSLAHNSDQDAIAISKLMNTPVNELTYADMMWLHDNMIIIGDVFTVLRKRMEIICNPVQSNPI